MSETMSNPTEWMQFYGQNYSGQSVLPPSSSTADHQPNLFPDVRVSDATAVTAAATGTSSPTAANRLSPEGRVSKPVRRRSRASRRTPTTLLNTDTTNFRAMVQQFTGGPSAPFSSSGSHPPAGFSFGLGARQSFANPSAVMVPGYPHNLQLHQQSMYQHQQQNQQYIFSGGASGAGHDNFFQRLSSGRPPVGNMGVSTNDNTTEGFLLGSQALAPAAPARPNSSNSGNVNRSNSFMF